MAMKWVESESILYHYPAETQVDTEGRVSTICGHRIKVLGIEANPIMELCCQNCLRIRYNRQVAVAVHPS